MARKIVNNTDPGTSSVFGGDDTDYINKYLTGIDQSATDPVVIATTTTFKNSKLLVRNPADTFSYTVIPSAIAAARNLTLPLLTADDTVATIAAIQSITNKTIDASQNTIKNIGTARYTIYVDPTDSKVRARNNVTGTIDYIAATTSAADATTCVQSALNNLTGGRTYKQLVKFIGSFTLTSVSVPSYTTLDFTDALITQANSTNTFLFVNSDTTGGNTHIEFFGGVVDGNRAGQSGGGVSYDTWNTFHLVKVAYGIIRDLHQLNSNGVAVRLNNCTDIMVTNCFFESSNQTTIDAGVGGARIFIIGNRFLNNDEGSINSTVTTDFYAIGNHIEGSGTTSINCNGLRHVIADNIIRNGATVGISLNSDTVNSGWDISGSIIQGNRVEGCPWGGIHLGVVTPAHVVLIKNNILKGVTTQTAGFSPGIRLVSTDNCILEGNVIYDWASNGISVEGYAGVISSHNRISNNICYNNGRWSGQAAARFSGISVVADVASNCIGNVVQGNTCYDNAVSSQNNGIYLSLTQDSIVAENDVRGNFVSGIQDAGGNVNLTTRNNVGYTSDSYVIISPIIQRWGLWEPVAGTTLTTASTLDGILSQHVITGTGTVSNTFDTTDGVLVNIASGASAGNVAGIVSPTAGVGVGRRLFGMKAVVRAKIDSTTTSKFLFGFTSATALPVAAATQPLAIGDHGVIVGFVETGAGSTNWTIWHNDATTSVTADNVGAGIAKDANMHTIEINWLASGNVNIIFDGTSQIISADLPATTANLFFNCVAVNTASAARTLTAKGIWIQAEK